MQYDDVTTNIIFAVFDVSFHRYKLVEVPDRGATEAT